MQVSGVVNGEINGTISGRIDAVVDGNVNLTLVSGNINEEKEECENA
jgi:hypothetical protein